MGIRAFLTSLRLYPHSSAPRPAHHFSLLSLASLTPLATMASSMLLRSTLPRTFASATGRNVLRSALQGTDKLHLIYSSLILHFKVRASSTTQYVPGGRTFNEPFCVMPDKLTLILDSYHQGHSQRPYRVPSSIEDAWLVSLGVRATTCGLPRSHDRSSFCDLRVILPSL
jgi:hypothetical protein